MSSRKLQLLNVSFQYPYDGGQFYYERTCYDEYFKLVERLLASGRECVTVTGTPGIGKSVFYAYFADRYLKAHSDTWITAALFINGVMTKAMLLGDQPSTMYPSAGDDLEAFGRAAAGRAQREGEKLHALFDQRETKRVYPRILYYQPGKDDAMVYTTRLASPFVQQQLYSVFNRN